MTFRDIFNLYKVLETSFAKILQKISFYTLDESSVNIIRKQMVLEPVLTSQGNIIPGLRKFERGSCVFYQRPNCVIYSNRPLSCQTYPLAFISQEDKILPVWVKNSPQTCPGIGKGSNLSSTYIKQLREQFFDAIEKHNQVVGELNIESSQGRPLSAREALWILLLYGEKEVE